MNKKNELLQVVAEMHYQAAGDWDIARSQAKNWADRLSTLTAQGGEIPQILRDSLEEVLKWSPKSFAGADAIRKFQELAGDYVQRLIEEGTTPPAPSSSAVEGLVRDVCELAPANPDDPDVAVVRVSDLERIAARYALASTAASGGECQHEWQPDADVEGASYCRRCDVTRRTAAPAMPDGFVMVPRNATVEMCEAGDLRLKQGYGLGTAWVDMLAAASVQGDGNGWDYSTESIPYDKQSPTRSGEDGDE